MPRGPRPGASMGPGANGGLDDCGGTIGPPGRRRSERASGWHNGPRRVSTIDHPVLVVGPARRAAPSASSGTFGLVPTGRRRASLTCRYRSSTHLLPSRAYRGEGLCDRPAPAGPPARGARPSPAACLMSRLAKGGGRLRIEDTKALDPGDLTISKARAAGWIRSDGQACALTPECKRLLDDEASRDDSRPWIHFVEERLGESLLVTCPTCAAELPELWLRPTLGCPSCHHRFPIHDSPPSLSVPGKT